MTRPKYLIYRTILTFLLFSCFLASGKALTDPNDCDQFKVNVLVNDKNEVSLEVSGLRGKQVLHLIGNKGFAKENISVEDLNRLGKGSYVLIVIDQKDSNEYCQKHFDFTIK